MKFNFIPLDYDSFDFHGENYVKVTGRSQEGKRICLIDNCDTFLWAILKDKVSEKKAKKLAEKINKIEIEGDLRDAKVTKTELHNKNYLGKKVKAIKIFVNNHKDMSKLANELSFPEIEKRREHDISFITRYILEKNLLPLTWHEVEGELAGEEFQGIETLDVDFCIKANKIKKQEDKSFKPKVLAFDIETEQLEIGKSEILMISLVSDNFKKVLTWKKCKAKLDYVECFDDEADMLEAFVKYVQKVNPDILTGYYSDGFDLPYIKARAEKNKVKLTLGIDNTKPRFSGGRMPRGKLTGVVHVDLFKFIETAYSQYLQSETLGLGDVAHELIGETKHNYEFKASEKMNHDDWTKFFEYNLQDSLITHKLFEKAWPDMLEFTKVMQEPLFEVTRNGMAANVENYIIHNLSNYNEIAEKNPTHHMIAERRTRAKYEGAFVLQPVPKLYEDIAMFDFTSFYPSIIATFNLSHSTYLEKKQPNSTEIDLGKEKVYFSKTKGFFPEMLANIINFRKKYKEELKKNPDPIKKARSNAFKLLANASYGYQGFFGARYYCPEAAAATTALSRKHIKAVIEQAKKAGFNPIYSDTDSIALELGDKTKAQSLEFLKKLNDKLPGILELELEEFYKRGLWVTTRGGEFGAKKKYALINEEGKTKIRGFETVRRDWCKLAREMQNKVLEKILKEGNEKSALEYVKEVINKLKTRKINKKKIIIKTQLKKPISEYKSITPHVTIAMKMIEQDIPVSQGMIIEYFIAEGKSKQTLKRDKAVFVDDPKPYDIEYYLNKQILPAVENIFQVFNINIKEVIEGSSQKTLF